MRVTEEEKRIAEEKANSYKAMMESWAWKDFEGYLERLRAQTVSAFVDFDERDAVEFKVGQFKGMLECLNRIKRELDFVVNP